MARQAKAICNGDTESKPCPVKQECLVYALVNGEKFGVWGGKSERERNRLRSQTLGARSLNGDQAGNHSETNGHTQTVLGRQKIRQ